MPDPLEVVVARVETRLIAVERDVREIKDERRSGRPSWPSVVSSIVAAATLMIVLMQNL